jgi:hypothetical protein
MQKLIKIYLMKMLCAKFGKVGRLSKALAAMAAVIFISLIPVQSVFADAAASGDGGAPSTSSSSSSDSNDSGSCPQTGSTSSGCFSKCTNDTSTDSGDCVNCSGGACNDDAANPSADCSKQSCDLVSKYVNPAINLLTLLFGLIAAASIILGAIQFSSSGGDPQKAAAARGRISKTVFAILTYAFLYAFLEFLIPGGIFNK